MGARRSEQNTCSVVLGRSRSFWSDELPICQSRRRHVVWLGVPLQSAWWGSPLIGLRPPLSVVWRDDGGSVECLYGFERDSAAAARMLIDALFGSKQKVAISKKIATRASIADSQARAPCCPRLRSLCRGDSSRATSTERASSGNSWTNRTREGQHVQGTFSAWAIACSPAVQ